jgi:hypothetical protein
MTDGWKLLSPRTTTWEDLPPSPIAGVNGFSAAVWTGAELVFLGGTNGSTGDPTGATAAYTPIHLPDK